MRDKLSNVNQHELPELSDMNTEYVFQGCQPSADTRGAESQVTNEDTYLYPVTYPATSDRDYSYHSPRRSMDSTDVCQQSLFLRPHIANSLNTIEGHHTIPCSSPGNLHLIRGVLELVDDEFDDKEIGRKG